MPDDRLIAALDVQTRSEVEVRVEGLGERVGDYKGGKELSEELGGGTV